MAALAMIEAAPNPFATVRALNRMRGAGFALSVRNDRLAISPFSRLSDQQRVFIGAHKPALMVLLQDAEVLHRALVDAGAAGLDWREGTPADWDDIRLLTAGEVLYGDRRMMNAHGCRYAIEHAPAIEVWPEYQPADCVPEAAPYVATDSPSADQQANLVAELMIKGWAPANAEAKARDMIMQRAKAEAAQG